MNRKARTAEILNWFRNTQAAAETELNYSNPFELLVAVVLSAQCTDKRINLVTPKLFENFPNPSALAAASFDEVFSLIRSVSYPNNKARHLMALAQKLISDYNSEIPETVEELQKLPGVGRKTANVIASVIYKQPTMAVDTHVFRVSARLGLTRGAKTPLATEVQLMRHIPEALVPKAHHWLILHGRRVCVARNPRCGDCGLQAWCAYFRRNSGSKAG